MYGWEMEFDIAAKRVAEMTASEERIGVPDPEDLLDPKSKSSIQRRSYNLYHQMARYRRRALEVKEQLEYFAPKDPAELKKLQKEYEDLRMKVLLRCDKIWVNSNDYWGTKGWVVEDDARRQMKIRIPFR